MTCVNCHSSENDFPNYPELFSDFVGWCQECIHEEITLKFKLLQERGAFRDLKKLKIRLEAGEVSKEEFERDKKLLFEI